jgi:hypothetical protein
MVVFAAVLMLGTLLLPWYSKNTTAVTRAGLVTEHDAKSALLVPSFIEASIFIVAVAVIVLMLARGEQRAFHLPFGDGAVVAAAGAWAGFLIFFRFVSPPASGRAENLAYDYSLSWGIFFGLLAAAFLLSSGIRLRRADVPEPPLDGRGRRRHRHAAGSADEPRPPRTPEPQRPPAPAPERRPAPPADPPAEPPTRAITPAGRKRPRIIGGTQLSFDEQE